MTNKKLKYMNRDNNTSLETWICNECGFSDWNGSITRSDIAHLQCSRCGGDEFHLSEQHSPDVSSVASHTSTVGNSIEQLRKAIVEIDKLRIKAVSNQQDDIYNDLITIQTRVFIAMDLIAPAPTTAPTQIEGWISVEDRLPEAGTWVIGFYSDVWQSAEVLYDEDGEWVSQSGSVSPVIPDGVITHWQPLPEAPKQ